MTRSRLAPRVTPKFTLPGYLEGWQCRPIARARTRAIVVRKQSMSLGNEAGTSRGSRLPSSDDPYEVSQQIMGVFPSWLVMWGAYSRQFWAFPCFRAPAGTIAHSDNPSMLAGEMRAIQRSVMGESR
jgi:hypothetical protein